MKWISIKDKKPEIGQSVVLFRDIESKQCYCTVWYEAEEKWYEMNEATYWIELPELPND